ncbi:MAG TPA: VOC family protein [Chthoniobacterales bacterium]|nr:VOC family protein [Chthoniobacterales bacterium]
MSIQVKEIAFVYYQVTDIARAREFYEHLLGLTVGVEYEGAPGKWWIEYDVGGVAFAIKNFDPSGGKGGAVLALEVADIDAAFTALRAAAVSITEELTEFPRCRSFTVKDPDGNEIILHKLKPIDQIPKFDSGLAKKVTPYLHEPTGRTVGCHQLAANGRTHLFSPTGFFVATERTNTPGQ